MQIKKAISLLKAHNQWRRGGEGKMSDPKELGIAIDTVVEYHLELEKEDFIGNYLNKKMKKHGLPYGGTYLNLVANHTEDAEKK